MSDISEPEEGGESYRVELDAKICENRYVFQK